jgi:3(or 17)beta-hydroxysteroid dehydrogenase
MTADRLEGRVALARAGARVVATDIALGAAEATAAGAGHGAMALRLDVADETAWAHVVAQVEADLGGFDVLVNSAGVGLPAVDIEGCTLADWRAINDINLDGVFFGCRAGLAAMLRGGRGGAIVNVSSQLGLVATAPDPAYCAGKGAVTLLTRAVARHCAQRGLGVRCNAVHPGYVRTAMTAASDSAGRALPLHPLGRLGEVGDIAPAIVFLAGERSRAVSGASFVVDGGYTAW